jgi:hypothetical protein
VFAAIRAGRVRVVTAPLEPLVRIREKWDGVASAATRAMRRRASDAPA